VNSTLASSTDLNRGTQFDAATESEFDHERKQAPKANTFAPERNYTTTRNAWTAQHASMATNKEETKDEFSTSAATNSLLGLIKNASRVSEAVEATLASSSGPNRGTRIVEATKTETKFESKREANSNIIERRRQDKILSNAWMAQHASTETRTGETGDILPPSATTSSWDSKKPRLMATSQWSPCSHIGTRSTTSLRRNSLRDTPLDHPQHQEACSFETSELREDIEHPLPLSDDSHVSFDVAEYFGSFTQDAGVDGQYNLENKETVDTNEHEIASHEVSGTNQLVMPNFARSTDQQLDAMLLELFRR
jgi:hypothetical protein